jgi:hypothetical protein
MNRGFSWTFLFLSGAFFVFIVGFTGYRIEDARKRNSAGAREHATSLAAKVRSLRDITGSLQSPLFKTNMREVVDSEPRLLLLSLHSPQDGLVYLVSRNRAALKEPSQITPEWRGTPAYQVNRGSEILVSSNLGSDMSGMTMDAVFVTMGREDLYPVVRDDLYFFLAFLLVCGVAILIAMSVEADAEPHASRTGATPESGAEAAQRPVPRLEPGLELESELQSRLDLVQAEDSVPAWWLVPARHLLPAWRPCRSRPRMYPRSGRSPSCRPWNRRAAADGRTCPGRSPPRARVWSGWSTSSRG